MSLLLSLHDLSKSFGSQNLFKKISFALNEGDLMGLNGPNGSGKSTLLKIIYGAETSDEGHIAKKKGLKVSYATQSPEFPSKSLEEVLIAELPHVPREEASLRAEILLDKAGFLDMHQEASSLSGGWKKRLDIVRAWMKEPDLVLLDEPTNHLDLEGIEWLENFLKKERAACLIVSHDRCFLENMCTKVAEINRCYPGGVFLCEGNWSTFLERKEAFLLGQKEQERSLRGIVKDEVEWLKKSPKARTTKSRSRIQKTHELMEELQFVKQRNTSQKAEINFVASERETKNLVVGKNLTKSLGGKDLFRGVDVKLSVGTRLGIVGRNGTGKTTLLKILSGEIQPDMGTVKYAQDLNLVYFDQHRETLDPSLTLKEALSPEGDFVRFQGQEIHVNGWAKRFLFPPERLNLPVHVLSGGERARILIARLMLKPADVLFLDEPTNDLDIPTLEVMEESLLTFPGAVVLITHDRYLMDRICTEILGLGTKNEQTLFADYKQWERAIKEKPSLKREEEKIISSSESAPRAKKLSYKEQKELDGMEKAISDLEDKLSLLHKQADEGSSNSSLELYKEMAESQKLLEALYDRWQVLLNK